MSALWDGVREGCGSCEFWDAPNQHDMAQCRRFPPVVLPIQQTNLNNGQAYLETDQHRPWTPKTEWCGEWKRKA